MKKPVLPAVLLLGAILVVPLAPSAAVERGGVTCRGLQVTHVGVPRQPLVTTADADVVVTNGARDVRTLGGDDIICVRGGRLVNLIPGAGNDLIDAQGFRGSSVHADLGKKGIEGSSGDDTYLGGRQWDDVNVSSGTATDRKRIETRGGADDLRVYGSYPGDVSATLGRGTDQYFVTRPRAGIEVDGGREPDDQIVTPCFPCESAGFSLGGGEVVIDDEPGGRAAHFEYLFVPSQADRMVREVSVRGTIDDNHIDVAACDTHVTGEDGADALFAFASAGLCDRVSTTMFGKGGDDSLYGTDGPDLLRGASGNDFMYGRGGR